MEYEEGKNPNDEELLEAWFDWECPTSLAWWTARVLKDKRYRRLSQSLRYEYPEADVVSLIHELTTEVIERRYRPRRSLTYFYSIGSRRALKAIGTHRKTRVSFGDPHEIAMLADEDAFAAGPDPERLARLKECVALLDESDRWLVEAVYTHNRPYASLGAELGQRENTVSRRVSRIRERLQACIQRPSH